MYRRLHANNQHAWLQSFAKSLLDVADNLERAAGAVPAEALQGGKLPAPELEKHLRTLLEGVQLTDKQLTAVRADWPAPCSHTDCG